MLEICHVPVHRAGSKVWNADPVGLLFQSHSLSFVSAKHHSLVLDQFHVFVPGSTDVLTGQRKVFSLLNYGSLLVSGSKERKMKDTIRPNASKGGHLISVFHQMKKEFWDFFRRCSLIPCHVHLLLCFLICCWRLKINTSHCARLFIVLIRPKWR